MQVSRAMEERQRATLDCTPEEAPAGGESEATTRENTAMQSTSTRWTSGITGSPVSLHARLVALIKSVSGGW